MSKPSRIKQALSEGYNVAGLAGAVALSAALLNPLPLLVGIAVEAAYLLFVPDSKWYENRLASRFDSEVVLRREALKVEVFPLIPEAVQKRFSRLEDIRGQIKAQPGMENAHWFREVVRKLDYLLEKFLLFARKEAEFRAYLETVFYEGAKPSEPARPTRRGSKRVEDLIMPFLLGEASAEREPDRPPVNVSRAGEMVRVIQSRYESERAKITGEIEAEEDPNTQAVLQKREDVLQQRGEYVGKIGKILTNLGHQMELLEDSFGLINDQLRARSPEQVLADIEGVVYQTDSMTRLLDELAPYESSYSGPT